MSKKREINIGDKFGHMTIIEELPVLISSSGHHERRVRCKCVCGNIKEVYLWNIIKRKNSSCGCQSNSGINFYKHGKSKTSIYSRYLGMIARCYDKSNVFYKDYGGRGIIVCDEWKEDFMSFYEWAVKNGFDTSLQLDRFPDNNGNYKPDNCRWATPIENCNNRRNSILFDYNGKMLSLPQIARTEKIHYGVFYHRVVTSKMSIKDAVALGKTNYRKDRSETKGSMRSICKELGISYTMILDRMKYRNISFLEAIDNKKPLPKKRENTITSRCAELGISYNAVMKRKSKYNETTDEAINHFL